MLKLSNQSLHKMESKINDLIDNKIEVIFELEEKESKKNNIILVGLDESDKIVNEDIKIYVKWCSLNKGNISVLALLDFSSAFDTIDHTILVHRLHTVNIT